MTPAALGVTCREAFQVFASNETLRLQSRVAELEARLARHEAFEKPLRTFGTCDEYFQVRQEAFNELVQWLERNVNACTRTEMDREDVWAVCDAYGFDAAISRCIDRIVDSKEFADQQARHASGLVSAVLAAAQRVDGYHSAQPDADDADNANDADSGGAWCNNRVLIAHILTHTLGDWMSGMLIDTGAVHWDDCPHSCTWCG